MTSRSAMWSSLVACGIWLSLAGSIRADEIFAWTVDEAAGKADLKFGAQPVLQYVFGYDRANHSETFKIFHQVYAPGADYPVTKGLGGLFPHHRGLYIGWNKVSYEGGSGDWWHGHKGVHQKHVSVLKQAGDAQHGSMTTEIHWNDAEGQPVIVEQRTVTVSKLPTEAAPGYGWQIDWQTQLTSKKGTITLDGDRQHAGFQYRADNSVAEANSARYIRPEGFPDKAEAFEVDDRTDPTGHVNLNWLAMHHDLKDRHYTVEYFEDPSLPKPSRYSERPYGRFGAFFVTKLEPEQPLTMKYRVLVTTETDLPRTVIQQRYEQFVKDLQTGAAQ